MTKKVALVTGANRGIGFEVARQLGRKGLEVVIGARDAAKGEAAAHKLRDEGLTVTFTQLDVADDGSVARAVDSIMKRLGHIDVLVNNAGIYLDKYGDSVVDAKLDLIRKTFETNTLGALRLAQKIIPQMARNGYGRVVQLSSGMGQLSEMNGGSPGYRISKTALNAVTRIFADEFKDRGVLVNSVCPGWVRTDMGGSEAELTVEQGADTVVWLATLPDNGPTGGFFREREPISW
jgi:NAD(P)-dependent dehydrogenase (short-subunit alcohol dehydrogenase family)